MPTRVVNKRTERFDVYIGRPSPFGNPFAIGRDGDRDAVIAKFKTYFYGKLRTDPRFKQHVLALKGKTLGCFCKPEACHGDVIVDYLDSGVIDEPEAAAQAVTKSHRVAPSYEGGGFLPTNPSIRLLPSAEPRGNRHALKRPTNLPQATREGATARPPTPSGYLYALKVLLSDLFPPKKPFRFAGRTTRFDILTCIVIVIVFTIFMTMAYTCSAPVDPDPQKTPAGQEWSSHWHNP